MKANCPVNSAQDGPVLIASSAGENLSSGFLDGLARPEINSILAAASLRKYSANAIVINQGDPADHLLLLRTGCARLFFITQEGRKVVLRWLLPGEILGGASLSPGPSTYLVSTEMTKDSSAFVWRRDTIRNLAAAYPKLLENALPFALDHLTWFLAAHLALVSSTARERLAQVLLSLAQGVGRKVAGGILLEITNEQLANAANVTPFTASRVLSEWRRSGTIVKNRGKILLHDPPRLFLDNI